MIARVFLDNDMWLIVSGLFGGLKVTLKPRNITIKASRFERSHLYNILDELKNRGHRIKQDSAELTSILVMFSEALLGRGDARWQTFFHVMSCESVVDSVINENIQQQKINIQTGLHLANLDAEFKEKVFVDNYGCSKCRKLPDAGAGYNDLSFRKVKTLYDTSHESSWLSECKYCKQHFLERFRDRIDWTGQGKDPMWMYWTPLTPEEFELMNKGEELTGDMLSFIGKRTYLECDSEDKYSWKSPKE